MENQTDTKLSILNKIIAVLPPVILILSNIFFFGPFTIYQGNLSEFAISFISIIKYFLLPSLILFSILSAVGILLPEKLHKLYVSLLFIFGILIWLQGNILVWDYGVFGKGDIDWTKDVWRGWIDAAVWVVLLSLAVFLYKHVYKIAPSASIAFFSLQAVLLVFNGFQQPDVWKRGIKYSRPPEAIFEFSKKQNIIHIILDELQSDVFQEIIEKDTAHYYNVFEGFTFFKETAGSFPSTMTSMPAIMSGQIYKNDVLVVNFIDSVFKGKTIPNVLYNNGYDVDLAAPINWYGKGRYTNWYYIPVPYGVSLNDYERTNSIFMMSLVAFRCAPHFLKKDLFNKVSSLPTLSQQGTESYDVLSHFANEEFLQDMINNISVKKTRPLYKFIHLTTTHYPAVLNANCQYAGAIVPWNWENIKIQAKCSLDHFIQFLNKLKSKGIYDSSLIILHADHGYYKVWTSINQVNLQNLDKDLESDFNDEEDFAQKVCASSPFLAIKLPYSKGSLKTSSAQTAITDIPATVSAFLNLNEKFTGRSVFEIDSNEVRERKFYYYYELYRPGNNYMEPMDEYSIKGSLYDRASWQFVSRHFPQGKSYSARKIDLGTDDATQFLHFGWSLKEKDPVEKGLTYVWALGKSASVYVTLPKTRVRLTANVKSPFKSGEQSVIVKVDGKEVGSWINLEHGKWEKYSVVIDANQNRPDVSIIEFIFSKYIEPTDIGYRRLALLFESITISDAPAGKSYSTSKINFGTDDAAEYLRTGWSLKEGNPTKGLTHRWALGNSASIYISLPKIKVKLTSNVRSTHLKEPQVVTVKVDGKKSGSWKISEPNKWERHSVMIEANEKRPSISIVEFHFSTHWKPDEKEYRRLALLFESITFEKQ